MENEKFQELIIRSEKINSRELDFFEDLKKDENKLNDFLNKYKLSKEDLKKADNLLKNIKDFPHLFVLACVMDRQTNAEKAWIIPYKIGREIGSFEFKAFYELNLETIKKYFEKLELHGRLRKIMPELFFKALRKIKSDYNSNASNIWNNVSNSAVIVKRFLEFEGIGIKIATMATNILYRNLNVQIEDKRSIEISPDTHIKRVFERMKIIQSKNKKIEIVIYAARELNPEYPGIFDLLFWNVGRIYCRPTKPDCKNCLINDLCCKNII